MKNAKLILVVLASLVLGSLAGVAGATTLSPIADTYVDNWAQNVNHAGCDMLVSHADVPGRIGYLKFDLSGFTLPAGQQISSAVLHVQRIWQENGFSDLSVNSVTDDTWLETMLFADRPAYGPALATETPGFYQYTNLNVTSAFNASFVPGDMVLSLALTSDGNIIYIASKENANSGTHPYLEITTVPVPEPATMGLLAMGGLSLLRRRV